MSGTWMSLRSRAGGGFVTVGTVVGLLVALGATLFGVGTTNHIIIELMCDATQAKYTIIHYKGSGQASIDVIAGQVPAQVDQVNSSLGHIRAGKLRALAVTSDKRVPELPDVPTFKESAIPELKDFTYSTFTGLFGPATTMFLLDPAGNALELKAMADPAKLFARD